MIVSRRIVQHEKVLRFRLAAELFQLRNLHRVQIVTEAAEQILNQRHGGNFTFFRIIGARISAFQDRRDGAFIKIKGGTAKEVKNRFDRIRIQARPPRSPCQFRENIQRTVRSVNRITPDQALTSMPPARSVGGKPFNPERFVISILRNL